MNKYLPSKRFMIIISVIVGVLVVSWIGVRLFSKDKAEITLGTLGLVKTAPTETTSVQNLIRKDSDTDGVPDWEEALWGTDPQKKSTNEGVNDSDFINQKKEELSFNGGTEDEDQPAENLSETEKFSREFFATVSALKQSGNLNESAISNISNVLGEKMSNSNLPANYSVIDIKKTYDITEESQRDFYEAVKESFIKYRGEGMGEELDSVDGTTGAVDSSSLVEIGDAYQSFAKEVLELDIPNNLTQNALDIINSAYNTGVAVKNLSKMTEDPLVGLVGLSQYQNYSEEFIKSSEELRTYLLDNDIIVE